MVFSTIPLHTFNMCFMKEKLIHWHFIHKGKLIAFKISILYTLTHLKDCPTCHFRIKQLLNERSILFVRNRLWFIEDRLMYCSNCTPSLHFIDHNHVGLAETDRWEFRHWIEFYAYAKVIDLWTEYLKFLFSI